MKAARLLLFGTLILCGNLLAQTNPIPFVNQPLVPDAAKPGGSGFTLTVNGTGFVSGSVVNWNKSPRPTTFVSSFQLTATISASDIASPNTAAVTVVNPSPGGGSSNPADFVVALPAPDVAMLIRQFDVGITMTSGVAGDFNGDGKLDVAVALNTQNGNPGGEVAVLLGKGDGSFRQEITIPFQFFAGNLIAGDFNADGKLDLALITNLNQVSVLLGNGDGTFQPARAFLTGIGPVSIVAGDFNHDGNLDLATSNSTDNSVSVLLGKGDGTFLPHVDTSTGGVSSYGLAVGDFNQDGKLDVAVTESSSNEVTILLGSGDGTFVFGAELLASNPGVVATADLNGDGKLDLIVGNGKGFNSTQTLFFGNGDGTFHQGRIFSRSGWQEQTATVADMNADGRLDLVVLLGNQNGLGEVSVLLGDGTGVFHPVYDVLTFIQLYGFPADVAVTGDFNNDGKIDVITSDFRNLGSITVLLQSPVVFSPASVGFGLVFVGKKSPKTVTLTNTDVSALTISSITVRGANSADFKETNDCPSSLAPGSNCTIKVMFRPSILGQEHAAIHVVDNGPRGGQSLPLSGRGGE
jgi:hypothetical protein